MQENQLCPFHIQCFSFFLTADQKGKGEFQNLIQLKGLDINFLNGLPTGLTGGRFYVL